MILTLDTSKPECKMALAEKGLIVSTKNWLAERRLALDLLAQIETFLSENKLSFQDLSGLVVFRGPGSFTGLRIGVSVANTLADSLEIPIVGELGESWIENGTKRLAQKQNDQIVLPEYGSPPHITQAKK